MSLAAGLALRMTWALATVAYQMLACGVAGHPGAHWQDGVRRCGCGRTWPG